ncbi:MAG: hypothetical protein GY820_38305 [Gammaproteobacteria bacterium]|nr:hypothetical protein [Gammaproteobacteria bacterium]
MSKLNRLGIKVVGTKHNFYAVCEWVEYAKTFLPWTKISVSDNGMTIKTAAGVKLGAWKDDQGWINERRSMERCVEEARRDKKVNQV